MLEVLFVIPHVRGPTCKFPTIKCLCTLGYRTPFKCRQLHDMRRINLTYLLPSPFPCLSSPSFFLQSLRERLQDAPSTSGCHKSSILIPQAECRRLLPISKISNICNIITNLTHCSGICCKQNPCQSPFGDRNTPHESPPLPSLH